MVWRLFLNRLPTKDSLIRRNVPLDVNDMTWVFCRDHNEFVEHVFISCKEIHALWIALIGWTALMLLRGIWELIFIRFHHAFGHNLRGKNGKLYHCIFNNKSFEKEKLWPNFLYTTWSLLSGLSEGFGYSHT